MKKPIYMDYHATTPGWILACSRRCCLSLASSSATPHSRNHSFGWEAEQAVEKARQADRRPDPAPRPRELSSPAGGHRVGQPGPQGCGRDVCRARHHIVSVATEHKAVLDTCKKLKRHGCDVTLLATGTDGLIDLDALRAAITEKTVLVSVMYAKHEIGPSSSPSAKSAGSRASEECCSTPMQHRRRQGADPCG